MEQSVPKRVLNAPQKKIITLVVENDLFGGGTDQNYTSGVRLNYTEVGAKFPEIAHEIDRLIPTFEINETSSIYYALGQSLYTPRDIRLSIPDTNDRPWAGFLYGSLGMITLSDNHTDEVEATLGIIGPAAMGKGAQKFIHKHLTNSPRPEGWSHQLKNEPGFMLAWQRGWPMILNGQIGKNFWALKPYAGATVGNVKTYGAIGFTLLLSPSGSKWQDTPLRVRPAMPGTGIYEIPRNKWSWSLFSGLEGRAVARDIFLDGNTFAQSYNIEKKPLVADANAGVSLTYNNTRISYTAVYRTKEFELQDDPEIFGALSLGFRF
ncbi:MAG: lipid A deacylase LpxR family protein [Alphaproteobacteria bacterium]|nr:lipid A deacylase LpxR family protein [Alphaproteobacteria bacterium]